MRKKYTSHFYNTSGFLTEHWYVACKSTDLKTKPKRSILFDIPLVIWRDSRKTPTVLLDRCCHRNAALSDGTVLGNNIKCPYHGWKFSNEGQCVNIPSEKNQNICKNFKVQYFHCKEKFGLIWVWMGKDEPSEEIFQMPFRLGERGYQRYYMVTDFENNVTDLVENFLDVPHTVFVHKGWFRKEENIKVPITVERIDDSVIVTYHQNDDKIGAFSKLLNPKNLPLIHTDKFYLPSITRVDYQFGIEREREFIITSVCSPVSEYFTRVYTLITYNFKWLNPFIKLVLPWYTKKVITQDVEIMKNQGENLKTFKTKDYRSTQADTLHIYVESLRDWEENGKITDKPKDQKRECEIWI